ncbi:MAG: hypothetical protein M3246_00095 [Actinomycetota bacterium]|jgi:hypothetical protein|nr:hypothetical protein [Actinomycetota bacterium]HZY57567.1 hypothetical protein [Rubrobacteraceae bacterium]
MSDEMQKRLVTILAGMLGALLSRPLTERFIDVPEERGIKDDIKEAALKAAATMASTIIASILVRQLLRAWR